jgi:hypothetical protein
VRAGELLGCEVRDRDGEVVGRVHDLLLRRRPGDPPGFELVGLICGTSAVGDRLGYTRGSMAGPWPLPALFRWLARRSVVVAWPDVAEVDRPRVVLRTRRDRLSRLSDQPGGAAPPPTAPR